MNQEVITEEMKLHEEWFDEARKQTVDTLTEFVRHLAEDYKHDYGTICHAIGAAGLAAMYAVENSPQGGITGFQAGFCMWDIIRNWSYKNNKCGLRIFDYDKLLYPQYVDDFCVISKNVLENLQKEAKHRIDELKKEHDEWIDRHAAWELEMEKFKVDVIEFQKQNPQYPPFSEEPNFYEHIGCGTAEEWDEESKKEASGFMFAPKEPYEPDVHPDVMAHWKMLADGGTPLGFRVED